MSRNVGGTRPKKSRFNTKNDDTNDASDDGTNSAETTDPTTGSISITNFYELLPEKKNTDDNPNFKYHGIKIPFRMLIVGASGAMKTNTALDVFQKFSGTFDRVTVICRNSDEPLYNYLKKKIPEDQLEIVEIDGDDLSALPSVDDFDKTDPSLVIFDDLCLVKNQKKISEFFIRARKNNVSCMYLTQSYFSSPKVVRINCNVIILKKVQALRDLNMILSEYALAQPIDQLVSIHSVCTQNPLDWLMIKMDNPPGEQFFHNYDLFDEKEAAISTTGSNPMEEKKQTAKVKTKGFMHGIRGGGNGGGNGGGDSGGGGSGSDGSGSDGNKNNGGLEMQKQSTSDKNADREHDEQVQEEENTRHEEQEKERQAYQYAEESQRGFLNKQSAARKRKLRWIEKNFRHNSYDNMQSLLHKIPFGQVVYDTDE